jgi:hypothetical protein
MLDYAGKHSPGGFSRNIGHGKSLASPEQAADENAQKSKAAEKKDIGKIESHAKEVTIRKEPRPEGGHKYTVKSHEGHETEHADHKSAMKQAASDLGEVSEPESAQDEVPEENPLGAAPMEDEGS